MNVLTVSAAAKELGIPEQTLYTAIHDKRLDAEKIGGTWLIEREDAERFVTEEWRPRNQAETESGGNEPEPVVVANDHSALNNTTSGTAPQGAGK